MAMKHVSIFLFICISIVTVHSQNITRSENPLILSRQGTQNQQRRGNVDPRDNFLNPSGNNVLGENSIQQRGRERSVSLQRRGNEAQRVILPPQRGNTAQRVTSPQRGDNTGLRVISPQRGGNTGQRVTSPQRGDNTGLRVTSPQRGGNTGQRFNSPQSGRNTGQRVTSPQRGGNTGQRATSPQRGGNAGRVTSPQRGGNSGRVTSQQREGNTGRVISPQRRGSDGSRRSLVQLRRSGQQGRTMLNLQNLPRLPGNIPRARNFQESLRNIPRRDPRTGIISRGVRPRVISNPLVQRTGGANNNPLCAPPRSIRCYSWPRNRDSRGAYVCDGRCQGRSCSVPCECSCVDPRLIDRLIAIGRISGPELTPRDPRLRDGTRRQRLRERILALQAARRRRLPVQTGSNTNRGGQTTELPRRNSNFDLNFGISDDVLATLIAQPVLNEIVGPQGINQIIAGEPPPLLLRDERRPRSRSPPPRTNDISQPDIRAVKTPPPISEPRIELITQDRGMGIPVPLSRLNFAPGTESNPAMGNMRVIMSDVRPFEDPRVGLNIDIPNPTPVDMPAESQVTVRQLPGTNVLFVDLTRSSQNGQTRGMPTVNMTSTGTGSISRNNILIPSTNQTITGSVNNGGNRRTFQDGVVSSMNPSGRPLTQDECLAQRTELWCDPKEPWGGTPGLFRWCLLNCRADNCDTQRCACACIDELLFKTKYEQLSLRAP